MSPINNIGLTERQVQSGLNISESAVRKLTRLNLLPSIVKKTQHRYQLSAVLELIKWRANPMPNGLFGLVVHISVKDSKTIPLPWCVSNDSVEDIEMINKLCKIVNANKSKYGHLPPNSMVTKGFPVSEDNSKAILGGKLLGSYAGFIASSATILMEISEAYDGKRYFIVLPDSTDVSIKWYRAPESGPTVRVILPA